MWPNRRLKRRFWTGLEARIDICHHDAPFQGLVVCYCLDDPSLPPGGRDEKRREAWSRRRRLGTPGPAASR